MTDEQALLCTILESPADDTARLVYADWLDDHGTAKRRARAEFIRVQCKLANPPPVLEAGDASEWHGQKVALESRQHQLLKTWGAAWLPKIGRKEASGSRFTLDGARLTTGGPFDMDRSYEFRRGFVEEIAIEYPTILPPRIADDCAVMFRRCPVWAMKFTILNHAPTVVVSPVHTGPDHWAIRVVAGDESKGEEAEEVRYIGYATRDDLWNRMTAVVGETANAIDFERIRDGDDFDVYPDDGRDHVTGEPDSDSQYGSAWW